VSSIAARRPAFGLSIGSIFASFVMIGGIQVLIAALRGPLSLGAVKSINWIISKSSHSIPALRIGAVQWTVVIENLIVSVLFVAAGLAIGAWLRRDRS
jgi:hypothetical protein